METSRKLLRVFVENLVVPVAVGVEDMGVVADYMKRGAVRYVRRRFGPDLELSANLLQKSTRWIYRVLEQDREGAAGALEVEDDAEERAESSLTLKRAAVQFFQSRYPQSLGVADCTRALRKDGYRVSVSQVEPLLEAYCTMGHLVETSTREGSRRVVSYQAAVPNYVTRSPKELKDRLTAVGVRARAIVPIAQAYVEGQPDAFFSSIGGELREVDYHWLSTRISEELQRLVEEAVARTRQVSADKAGERTVRFLGLYMMGQGGWTDFEFFRENVEGSEKDGVDVS